MPLYEYMAAQPNKACNICRKGFTELQRMSDPPITRCPACGASVVKCISAPNVGASQSGLDDRAKSAGFHKLKKTGKGEYEKQY